MVHFKVLGPKPPPFISIYISPSLCTVRTLLDTNVMCELDPCVSIKEISADGPHRTTVALILTVHPMYGRLIV